MDEEITALENDETCESVDRSRGKKPADCMWIYIKKGKRATRCTEAPAFAGSGKGSHHLVYCTQPYPVFTQEAVSRT